MFNCDIAKQVLNAAHDMGIEIGAKQLAPVMGCSSQIASNKLNPNNETHKLSVADLVSCMAYADDFRPLAEMARGFGFELKRAGDRAECRQSVYEAVMKVDEAKGSLSALLAEAMADGQITPREERELAQAVTGLQELVGRLVVRSGKIS
ncbi:phage regulatory CII family protein [Ferrimonas balearica]|uniref:phage regulatory CII family protein n=1 Tax=Ferrimonas balearica TaxID=44012 RepID=UPI001C959B60|nr:phage regulatory CII family protein [Ferrimonas balearica]MBY6104882.1 phage regulatory CII family protein [Ferrimonas balearica]